MYFQKIFYALFKAFDDEKLPIIDCSSEYLQVLGFSCPKLFDPNFIMFSLFHSAGTKFSNAKNLLLYFLHAKTMSPCNNSIKDNLQMQKNKFRITRTKQLKDMIEIDIIRRRHYRNGMLVDYRLSFLHKSHSCLCKLNSTTNFSRIPGFRR